MSEEKPQRLRSGARALCFAVALPGLQAIARQHGYALAVHGSMMTDLDLVAVPWIEEAADAEVLIEALKECIGGHTRDGIDPNPSHRPHGRLAWSIYCNENCCGPYLDVSVMPRRTD